MLSEFVQDLQSGYSCCLNYLYQEKYGISNPSLNHFPVNPAPKSIVY